MRSCRDVWLPRFIAKDWHEIFRVQNRQDNQSAYAHHVRTAEEPISEGLWACIHLGYFHLLKSFHDLRLTSLTQHEWCENIIHRRREGDREPVGTRRRAERRRARSVRGPLGGLRDRRAALRGPELRQVEEQEEGQRTLELVAESPGRIEHQQTTAVHAVRRAIQ